MRQRFEKSFACDRPDRADGEIEAGEESGIPTVARELDVGPFALQNRCKSNRAANVRKRDALGDE